MLTGDDFEAATDAVNGRLATLAGHLNVVNAQLTEQVAELLADNLWQQGAVKSPSAFLQWKLGLSPARAEAIVRIATRRHEFPVVMAAFDRGELSLEQVDALMTAPAWADEQLLDFARLATVTKIRRGVRSERFEHDPTDPGTAPKPPVDTVSFGVGRDGRWRMHANLDAAAGQRLEAALNETRDRLFTDGNHDVTWPETLVEMAERSLDTIDSTSRRDRYRTWLHLNLDGDVTTTDGWRVPMTIRDHLLCDGQINPVLYDDGIPFSVGRAQHIVPDRTRRIIELRDRGCRVPGCNATHVEIHHIVHWLNGGTTDTCNLISLCPHHHRLHHRGDLGITGNADIIGDVIFTDARGDPIPETGTPTLPTGPPPRPQIPYREPLRERFDWNWIGGWIHPNILERRRRSAA